MWDEMGFVNNPEEDNMPVIPVSRTRFLIEVAPDIEPAEVAGEVRVAAGSQYHIAPSGSVRARAAQGPAAPVWLMATPAMTTPTSTLGTWLMTLPRSPQRERPRRFNSSSRISCRASYTNGRRSRPKCSDLAAGSVNRALRART